MASHLPRTAPRFRCTNAECGHVFSASNVETTYVTVKRLRPPHVQIVTEPAAGCPACGGLDLVAAGPGELSPG